MISSLRALLQRGVQESWDELQSWWEADVADSKDTGSRGGGSLGHSVALNCGGSMELLWGSVQELPRQCCTPRAVTLAGLFRAKSTKWHHWEACLAFNPLLGAFSSCLWDVVVADGGWRAGMLSVTALQLPHAGRARPFLSLPEHSSFLLSLPCRPDPYKRKVLLQLVWDTSAWTWASRISRCICHDKVAF